MKKLEYDFTIETIKDFGKHNLIPTVKYTSAGARVVNNKNYIIYTFTSSGIIEIEKEGYFDYMIIGGGGSNGVAGSYIFKTEVMQPGTYSVIIGAGGFDGRGGSYSMFLDNIAEGGKGNVEGERRGFLTNLRDTRYEVFCKDGPKNYNEEKVYGKANSGSGGCCGMNGDSGIVIIRQNKEK